MSYVPGATAHAFDRETSRLSSPNSEDQKCAHVLSSSFWPLSRRCVMSALLESLLDATRRADCAANDLEFGCSPTSTPLQEQMREEAAMRTAAEDTGDVSPRPARAAGLDQT